jgi:hypothetical protein
VRGEGVLEPNKTTAKKRRPLPIFFLPESIHKEVVYKVFALTDGGG